MHTEKPVHNELESHQEELTEDNHLHEKGKERENPHEKREEENQ